MSYWPLMLMGLLAIAGWVPQIWQWKNRRPRIWGNVLPVNGVAADGYHGVINGKSLREFKDKYVVAIVTGNMEPAIDKFEDARIGISQPFTIESVDIPVFLPWSAATMQARGEAVEQIKQKVKLERPDIPTGMPLLIPVSQRTWQEVILLPRGVSIADVHKLSDVAIRGGKVVSKEIADGRIELMP